MSKVFISYSHDSPTHSNRVLAFATALGNHGIEVELDQFHTDEIVDWPRWCNEQISRDFSDFVLCVCTEEYQRRIECKVPPEKGKGVYWEGSLVDDEIYDDKGNQRFLPVLFNDEAEKAIPRILRGWTFCRLRDFVLSDSGFENVIRILTRQPSVVKNPLGPIPILPSKGTPVVDPAPSESVEISPPRLRHGADHLFGREVELARLNHAWKDPATHVFTIVAWGGVGKTSLLYEWMNRWAAEGWPGCTRVFEWTFYSQGTREQGEASSDSFIAEALRFFGDEGIAQSPASPWDKGARLAQLVAQKPSLLVLDGLEPLQYPPGSPLAGQLKDPALQVVLKTLARHNPGLCLVTTRESVAELAPCRETTAPELLLQRLSTEAGVELLKKLGVRGCEDEERRLVEDVCGHALTLNLLGRYLAKAHGGDIRRRDRVKLEKADAKMQVGHAFKAMAAYDRWLAKGGEEGLRQRAVLQILGLFDRPAETGCLSALRAGPAIPGLTEPLVGLDEDDWNITLSSLAECGLISLPATDHWPLSTALDTHPLIREYFAQRLRQQNLNAWRAAHLRIYQYLKNSVEYWPNTLGGLQPLYQAVVHGCQASSYQQVCKDVFWDRISRGEGYSLKKLGAVGADLGAIACFFQPPWSRLATGLSETYQACLLTEAAIRLSILGRLAEALEPMRIGLDRLVKQEDWENATVGAISLSELKLNLGSMAGAVGDAEQSVAFADRFGHAYQRRRVARAALSDALHQSGRSGEALELFREAEAMTNEFQPRFPLLYSFAGFKYCELLLAEAERAAWQACGGGVPQPNAPVSGGGDAVPTLIGRCREVEQRAEQTLQLVENLAKDIISSALDHLTLGRAALYRAILGDLKSAQATDLRTASEQLATAVGGLRCAGATHHIPRGLLSRAWLRFLDGDTEGAKIDLGEAWEIAERGPMPLFMADIHLHRARLFHDQAELAKAAALIEKHGYGRRREELADAQAAARFW